MWRLLPTSAIWLMVIGVPVVEAAAEPLAKEITIWDGVYTNEQSQRGQRVYDRECAACHLDDLSGDGDAPALIGRPFYVRWSDLSIGDWIAATRATMPKGAPDSLSQVDYVALAAYVLEKNAAPSGDTELPIAPEDLWHVIIAKASK